MSRRHVAKPAVSSLPPLLVRIIEAARHAPHDPTDRTGHDQVLEELSQWALVYVPSRGVLAPSDESAYKFIEGAAVRYLEYGDARRAFQDALQAVASADERNLIEEAHNRLQTESDDAYYYAGLACGVTLAQLSGIR